MAAPLSDIARVFGKIGILSFGGPAAQIAVMHRVLVDERGWLTEKQYLNALSFCMLLPGPEATQLATYAGWRLQGVRGGLLAGLLFVLPGALVMLGLASAYAAFGQVPLVEALFLGIKATVIVVVIEALLRVAKRALKTPDRWVLAGLSFLGIFAFHLPFPLIIVLAAAYGALTGGGEAETAPPRAEVSTLRTILIWGTVWLAPIALVWALGQERLVEVGLFFAKLAVVTFGGAYAVLAYMAQEVVADRGWLTATQMLDGLGLAETTPGPLILVTEFVGYQAGYDAGGPALAVAAAALTLWVTFAPCFLWIFAGAPYIEWIATRPRLTGALSAITAAVVGVILNLSLWFATHVFFGTVTDTAIGPMTLPVPDPGSLDPRVLALSAVAAFLIFRLRRSLPVTLGLMALAGVAVSAIG
ncbi:MAG: chromate efflux transporter [Rhodobacteraceae bacterium]|nr:chromate efflux transporter [Paracoccaceae bacterium]